MKYINFIYLRSVVSSSKTFHDEQRNKFLSELNKFNDFVFTNSGDNVFFIETGGTEESFKEIYKNYKEPYLLVATNANNSLPASLEIATFLRNQNKKFKLFHGTPKEVKKQLIKENIGDLQYYSNKLNIKPILNNKNYGVIGRPSDWLIASEVDYKNIKEKLNANIIDIDINELINLVNSIDNVDDSRFIKYLNNKVSAEVLQGALKIYESIKILVNKYKLDGVTIRCFDLLNSIKNTSCLALALLNEEGIIATCEGDVPTMLTMAIIRELYGISSFQVNPSYVNLEKNYAYLAHCTLPLDMTKKIKFDTHFESGIGIGIKGKLLKKDITIFKINKDFTDYEIFSAKIQKNLNKKNLCRTQIKVKFNDEIKPILSSPNGNHLVVFYGNLKNKLISTIS